MINGLQLSIPQRMLHIRITTVLALLISVFLSLNLWAGERSFPYAGIFNEQLLVPPFDYLFVVLAVVLLAGSLLVKRHRLLIFIFLVLALVWLMFDINRCQPWFYTYCFLLLVFVFYDGRVDDSNKFTSYFILLQLIFASVYFFCGLSQLNAFFVDHEFRTLIAPLKSMVSERQFSFFIRMGLVVPYLLMFVGIGLIIAPIRYLAITLGVLIHLILLVLLFPSSLNLNYALWFSNFSFLIIMLLLFSGKTKQRYFSPTFLFQLPLFYLVVVFCLALPFLNKSGYWPDYLSSNFRSGANKRVEIKIAATALGKISSEQSYFIFKRDSAYYLNYTDWSLATLNAPCFPDERTFNSIYKYVMIENGLGVKEIELQRLPPK